MSFKPRGKAKKQTQYALYHGDKYIYGGTAEELTKYMGLKDVRLINYFASPSYRKRTEKEDTKRIIIIKVEEDENENT